MDAVEKELVLGSGTNELVFTYSSFKNATVTVHFVDMDGNAIATKDVQHLKVGKTFTLARNPIDGWELNKAVVGTEYGGDAAGSSYKITEDVTTNGLTFTLFYQKKVTITAISYSKQYNGTALTLPAELNGQVKVEGKDLSISDLQSVEFSFANSDVENGRLNAGTATVTPENAVMTGNHAVNYYAIRYISGTYDVTKINVTVRIEPDRWTGAPYTGESYLTGFTHPTKTTWDQYIMISHEGYAEAYLDDIAALVVGLDNVQSGGTAGMQYYVKDEKDVGDYNYDLALTSADLPNGNGNYSVSLTVRPGRLQIVPAEITIATGSASKQYDGTPLTAGGTLTLTVDKTTTEYTLNVGDNEITLATGDTITVKVTGSQTPVGGEEGNNTYEIVWGEVNSNNYTIKKELGTLTVTAATLTVTVKDKTVTYNGAEQTGYTISEVTGTGSDIDEEAYTVTGLAEGDVLTVTGYVASTGTHVVGSPYDNGSFEHATIKVMRGAS